MSALALLTWGPDTPSTTDPSISMTMAFGVVALTAVNLGLVLRRERQPAWASPVFPYLGWIFLGWLFTWAAVELNMFQRLLLTTSLSGGEWAVVIGLSWLAPAVVAVDKAVQAAAPRPSRGMRVRRRQRAADRERTSYVREMTGRSQRDR